MSPVKSQCRGGGGWGLGLKMIIPFPLKFIRGLCFWVLMPVLFWEFVHFVGYFLWVIVS
jgi:hypothetical protein